VLFKVPSRSKTKTSLVLGVAVREESILNNLGKEAIVLQVEVTIKEEALMARVEKT